jgi:hypothetical protein
MARLRGINRLTVVAILSFLTACNGSGIGAQGLPASNPTTESNQSAMRMRAAGAAHYPLDVAFAPAQSSPVARVYQPDWAGPVLFAPDQKPMHIPTHRFHIVEGEWVVPKALPTINCSNRYESTDGSSLWIAIDGWSATFKAHAKGKGGKWYTYDSTDILQAGSESDVPCYHGGPLRRYPTSAYFWIEWAGVKNIAVIRHHRNLTLRPGDKIYGRLDAATSGSHAWREATLRFVNETTGYYLQRTFHSGCIDCGTPFQRPATLFGNTAEWIVEATFYDYGDASLPNTLDDFGTVPMTHVDVTDQTGVTYDLTQTHGAIPNVDWMTWNGVPLSQKGTLLACATIDGPNKATFARAPYAIVTPGQQGDLEPKPKHCEALSKKAQI